MRWRNQNYLDWVKSNPCCNCGAPADDAHHIIGVGKLSGMGLKAPDQYSMPLCRGCHSRIHNEPYMWDEQWEWISRTLAKAIEEGVFN